jgi:hypothetical protein
MHNDYAEHNKRKTIAACLKTMGLNVMADKATLLSTSSEIIDNFLSIIQQEALIAKRHDVLEQLYFSGLVYG